MNKIVVLSRAVEYNWLGSRGRLCPLPHHLPVRYPPCWKNTLIKKDKNSPNLPLQNGTHNQNL